MTPLLEVNNLQYFYGGIPAIKKVDLYVNEGEMVMIIGANGAGKTTALQTISGLTAPSGLRGEIIFDGRRIHKKSGHSIAKLGLIQVLEGRRLFPKLTVDENLSIGAYLRKDRLGIKGDRKRIYQLFPRLDEFKNRTADTLSGGEQQMLAIGRALIGRPKMILLDEPSLGLAPFAVKEVFETIKSINREGLAVLFVEQNSKIALATATRGYVMKNGEIVISGDCKSLMQDESVQKTYLGIA